MTRRANIIQPISHLPVSRRGVKRFWISAILYIMACIWLGPDAAFWLTTFFAIVFAWMWLAWRFPTVGYLTYVFFYGLVGGLLSGLLGNGAGYAYYHTPRYRRRRRR